MSRRLRLGLLTTAAGLVGVALLVALLAALNRPGLRHRVDLSASGEARLSSRSLAALESLPEGARLTAFLLAEDPSLQWFGATVYPQAFDRLRSYLEDLRVGGNGRLEVLVLEASSPLVLQQQEAERLAREVGDLLVIEAGETRRVLRFEDLFQVIQAQEDGRPARLNRQRIDAAVGDALAALASGEAPRVAVVTGTGQGRLDDPEALAPLAEMLAQEGYEMAPVRGPAEALEQDCALLIVAGQQQAFLPADREAAAQWIAEERPLLLALGAFAPDAVIGPWNELLAPLGTGFDDGLLCEPLRVLGGLVEGRSQVAQLEVAPDQLAAEHPITRALVEAQRFLLVPLARPLRFESGSNAYGQERLLRSGRLAWIDQPRGEAFVRDQGEVQGIQALGVAVAAWAPGDPSRSGRSVVLASAELLRRSLPLNRDLIAASCAWLLGDDRERQGLVALEELPFRPERTSLARLHNLTVLAIPGSCFLLALGVFFRRRR